MQTFSKVPGIALMALLGTTSAAVSSVITVSTSTSTCSFLPCTGGNNFERPLPTATSLTTFVFSATTVTLASSTVVEAGTTIIEGPSSTSTSTPSVTSSTSAVTVVPSTSSDVVTSSSSTLVTSTGSSTLITSTPSTVPISVGTVTDTSSSIGTSSTLSSSSETDSVTSTTTMTSIMLVVTTNLAPTSTLVPMTTHTTVTSTKTESNTAACPITTTSTSTVYSCQAKATATASPSLKLKTRTRTTTIDTSTFFKKPASTLKTIYAQATKVACNGVKVHTTTLPCGQVTAKPVATNEYGHAVAGEDTVYDHTEESVADYLEGIWKEFAHEEDKMVFAEKGEKKVCWGNGGKC